MQLPIWTRRLEIKRELWHIQDFVPGFPIPVVQAVSALTVLFVEWLFLRKLSLSLPGPGFLQMLLGAVLPGAAWFLAGRPAIQGKAVQDYFCGQLRFWLLEPRLLIGEFEPVHEPVRTRWAETEFEEPR